MYPLMYLIPLCFFFGFLAAEAEISQFFPEEELLPYWATDGLMVAVGFLITWAIVWLLSDALNSTKD